MITAMMTAIAGVSEMSGQDIALIIGAVATLVTALAGLAAVVMQASKKNLEATAGVHTIVNQQRTDAKNQEHRLEATLRKHGIEVPPDPSLEPKEPEPPR